MLSRVAEAIYWMSRHIERAENVARVIDVNFHLNLDLPLNRSDQWEPLVRITDDHPLFQERYDSASGRNVIRFLAFDTDNPNSIISCIEKARENARSVREVISSEMWEHMNTFYLNLKTLTDSGQAMAAPHQFFGDIKRSCHLFAGITDATLSHGEAWHFHRLGCLLERADKTARLVDVKYYILLPDISDVGSPFDNIQWSAVLKSASALEMYRKRWQRITHERVADFLILDRDFPRAVHYCLLRAEYSIHEITDTSPGTFSNPAEKVMGQIRTRLDFTQIEEIVTGGLHEFLTDLKQGLFSAGESIQQTFFEPAGN
ncbi:alpha-E domain-containing protein [bacterium]|nr:alpha-E domain-containing protein [bacterium]